MIAGLGTDIIEIERIKEAIDRHREKFVKRLFTEKERAYCEKHKDPLPRYAGRFAAKEAIIKALNAPELSWLEIEILNDEDGKPHASVEGEKILISISHCKTYATATALVIGDNT